MLHAEQNNNIDSLNKLWEQTTGHPDVRIAVLDGVVDTKHECLKAARLSQLTTIALENSAIPSQHGTHICSVIFGDHRTPIKGLAPKCTGISIPIYSQLNNGVVSPCSQIDLARAIMKAIEAKAHIINISGGQLENSGNVHPILKNALEACEKNNVLLIAAVGNDGCQCLNIPAAIDSTLAVGATDEKGTPLPSSNWGSKYKKNGILTYGKDINGAFPDNQYGRLSGTSFATAITTGFAALLVSLQIERHQTINPLAVRQAILSGTDSCTSGHEQASYCDKYLAGTLNLTNTLKLLFDKGIQMMTNEMDTHQPKELVIEPCSVNERESKEEQSTSEVKSASEVKAVTVHDKEKLIPAAEAELTPSGCGCSSEPSNDRNSLVYALGSIDFDFGTEARKDAFIQNMPFGKNNPYDTEAILSYLDQNPYEAQSLIWTLNLDVTPIYAIQPIGPFANIGYEKLREALQEQMSQGVELVSIPGITSGSITLSSGQTVPLIVPNPRGIYSWSTKALVDNVLGKRPTKSGADQTQYDEHHEGLSNFLSRVYYDLRNLGMSPEERALNYSATNAFQVSQVIESTTKGKLELDDISVQKSPVSRPDSDCYDVEISFFNPTNTLIANKIFRFTVDVSGDIPVTIGEVRSWSKR
ncbi:PatA/PatG family cyanobactin maturation protease [Vibrio cionasavignyae]|uniref:PatA/PatG family cyanobactin maturation protease n=1 Tax=Vibrio cionasavignyae TaxID=2910252 RepID=UPI003D0A83E6